MNTKRAGERRRRPTRVVAANLLGAYGRVALLTTTQPEPTSSMLLLPLSTTVLSATLLGQVARIPVSRFENTVLSITLLFAAEIPSTPLNDEIFPVAAPPAERIRIPNLRFLTEVLSRTTKARMPSKPFP